MQFQPINSEDFGQLSFPLANREILGLTRDSEHFKNIDINTQAMIPLPPHPGGFGVTRKFHVHEGVDLYCRDGEEIYAINDGTVVAILPFTGAHAQSPWWGETWGVLVETPYGVINYGEVKPADNMKVGLEIKRGDLIGNVVRVLLQDKGRPRDMLHFELYEIGTRDVVEWKVGEEKPASLCDPTELLAWAGGVSAQYKAL